MSAPERLARRAAEAAQVRRWSSSPDFVALRVERVRSQVDALMWAGILGGLAFTAANVQTFAAAGQPIGSAGWWVAWLLDPMVSLVLVAVLRAEQVTARWQVPTGPWTRRARWFCLAATYVMNTWTAWEAGEAARVVLHSVPPLIVFVAAEAVTDLRDKLTDAAHHAADPSRAAGRDTSPPLGAAVPDQPRLEQERTAGLAEPVTEPIPVADTTTDTTPDTTTAGVPVPATSRRVHEPRPATAPATAPATLRRAPARRSPARPANGSGSGSGRTSAADYAWTARMALTPEVEITPAWVRQVTGCSRGLSSQLARTLRDEQHAAGLDDADQTDEHEGDDTGGAPVGPENAVHGAVNAPHTDTDNGIDSTGAAGEHRTERPEGAGRERQVA